MNCKWAEKWELENARETTVWLCKSPKRLVALRTCTYRFEDGARTKLYRGVAPQWLSTKQVEELVRYKLLKEE